MARPPRPRSGPSYGSLIIFIVLCVILVIGYIPLALALANRATALNELHRNIKEVLEDTVGRQIGVSASPVARSSEAAYGRSFFTPIADKARMGLKYEELVKTIGWTGEDPARAMTEEFQLEPEKGKTLRQYLLDQRRELDDARTDLQKALRAEHDANVNYENIRAQLQEEKRRREETVAKLQRDIEQARRDYVKKVDEYKKQWEQANRQQEDWSKKYRELYTKYESEKAKLQQDIARLEVRVGELREELAKRKPEPVKVKEGLVLRADATEGIAIINMGRREGVEPGEKFTVMRIVPGGQRVPKGEVQVIGVEDLVSRADIIQQDEEHFIMAGDIVRRQKELAD